MLTREEIDAFADDADDAETLRKTPRRAAQGDVSGGATSEGAVGHRPLSALIRLQKSLTGL